MQVVDAARRKLTRSKSLEQRAVFDNIIYSQCWEDPEIASLALQISETDRVLCLTSGGDNALALALDRPQELVALDFSLVQNATLELKMAAIRTLDWERYVAFLGARPSIFRLDTYADSVRSQLSEAARTYFDGRPDVIRDGVIHQGRFQNYLRLFRTRVLPLIHSRGVVETYMGLTHRDERAEFYRTVWDNRRWRALFTLFFGRAIMARLGRDPEFFRYVDRRNVGAEFLRRTERAMLASSPADNHFLQYLYLGSYPDMERAPVYLRPSSFDALRDACDRISIVTQDLEGYLRDAAPQSLSRMYLSDAFEWVSADKFEELLTLIIRASRPGGRYIYWNLLVPRHCPPALASQVERHEEFAAALAKQDQNWVYGAFQIESIRGE